MKKLIQLYQKIDLIRSLETVISQKYQEGKMRCPVHLSIGQEAPAVGICSALKKTDQVVSTHRCHAHYIAKGGSIKNMMAEIYGKNDGCANGKGGSMHLFDLNVNFMASIPIVGSIIPIGTGLAFANKLKNNNKTSVIFFGDGATEEGVFFESLDFSALHNLNVLFVCENNFFSVYSPLKNRQSKKRNILKIAKGMGIPSTYMDGNDVMSIFKKTKKILKKMRTKKGPHLIILDTFRWLEHCGPNNDDNLRYRDQKIVKKWKSKCPLKKIEKKLKLKKIIDNKKIFKIKNQNIKKIFNAFGFAEKSKFPKISELNKNIYA